MSGRGSKKGKKKRNRSASDVDLRPRQNAGAAAPLPTRARSQSTGQSTGGNGTPPIRTTGVLSVALRPRIQPASDIRRPDRSTPQPARPRPQTGDTPNTPRPTARRRAQSIPAEMPAQSPSLAPPPPGTIAPNGPAARGPAAQRQNTTLRLALGDATFARLPNLLVSVPGLSSKPGMLNFLGQYLTSDQAERPLSQLLRAIMGTVAIDFPTPDLNFLYRHIVEVRQHPNLKTFLINALANGVDQTQLESFLATIQNTAAATLSDQQLDYLYSKQATLQNQPELTTFLIATLPTQADTTALDQFLSEIKDTPAMALSAPHLGYLYSKQADLENQPELKTFLITTLAAPVNLQAPVNLNDLDQFLADIHKTDTMQLPSAQLGYLYRQRALFHGQPGLQEFLTTTLATDGDLAHAELDQFLPTIQGTLAVTFPATHLGYLYDLRADLNRSAIAATPAQADKFVQQTVLELAIDRLHQQTLGPVKAELDTLRSFGYNERLYRYVLKQAVQMGKKNLAQDLADLTTQEKQALAAIAPQVENPGPAPTVEGSTKNARRAAAEAKAAWDLKKANYDDFLEKQRPIKEQYKVQRDRLKLPATQETYTNAAAALHQQFVAATGFHTDAEWSLTTAQGDIAQAQILFSTCQTVPMKVVGQWAVKQKFDNGRLQTLLNLAATLNLNPAEKIIAVAPFILDCPVLATNTWLTNHAATTSVDLLKTDIELLRKHTKPAIQAQTQALLIQAIGLEPNRATLKQYNTFLVHPVVGAELVQLMQNRTAALPQNQDTDTAAVIKFFNAFAHKLDDLATFLQAATPRPAGYASLGNICALVQFDKNNGSPIGDVEWAMREARRHNVGQPYIQHILTRLKEKVAKASIQDHDMGYHEWLLVSGQPWGNVTVTTSPFGTNKWTGIFELTINGTAIEIHNHFTQAPVTGDGEQYSLHLKHGKASFEKGPELTPKDKSVYQTISTQCRAAYIAFVDRSWGIYDIPKN
ncbi:hypothetical protein ACN4EG_17820 [Alkalinema pantanalense CENA528]|uniref:hypothetical protein n=1 Tax=Alkalinema pantanalense TaxID=1620705 RepID=UPI003D6E511E